MDDKEREHAKFERFIQACYLGDETLVEILLDQIPDEKINTTNSRGAGFNGHENAVAMLLIKGANAAIKNLEGISARDDAKSTAIDVYLIYDYEGTPGLLTRFPQYSHFAPKPKKQNTGNLKALNAPVSSRLGLTSAASNVWASSAIPDARETREVETGAGSDSSNKRFLNKTKRVTKAATEHHRENRATMAITEKEKEAIEETFKLGFISKMQKITIIGSTLNVNYLMSLLCGNTANEKLNYFVHAETLYKVNPYTLDEIRTKQLSKLFLSNPGLLIYTAATDAMNYKVFHEFAKLPFLLVERSSAISKKNQKEMQHKSLLKHVIFEKTMSSSTRRDLLFSTLDSILKPVEHASPSATTVNPAGKSLITQSASSVANLSGSSPGVPIGPGSALSGSASSVTATNTTTTTTTTAPTKQQKFQPLPVPTYLQKTLNEFLKMRATVRLISARDLVAFFIDLLFPQLQEFRKRELTVVGDQTRATKLFTVLAHTEVPNSGEPPLSEYNTFNKSIAREEAMKFTVGDLLLSKFRFPAPTLERETILDRNLRVVSRLDRVNPEDHQILLMLPKWQSEETTFFHASPHVHGNWLLSTLERCGWITPVYLSGEQDHQLDLGLGLGGGGGLESEMLDPQHHGEQLYFLQDLETFLGFVQYVMADRAALPQSHVTMSYERFLFYARDYFGDTWEVEDLVKLMLNYEVVYDRSIVLEDLNAITLVDFRANYQQQLLQLDRQLNSLPLLSFEPAPSTTSSSSTTASSSNTGASSGLLPLPSLMGYSDSSTLSPYSAESSSTASGGLRKLSVGVGPMLNTFSDAGSAGKGSVVAMGATSERVLAVPFLMSREAERNYISKFYSAKGDRFNRNFVFTRDVPISCCSRIFATILAAFNTGTVWSNYGYSSATSNQSASNGGNPASIPISAGGTGQEFESINAWTNGGQSFLLYRLHNNSSLLLRYETAIIMLEFYCPEREKEKEREREKNQSGQDASSAAANNCSPEVLFFCHICHFIRSVIQCLYWRLDGDELIECPCKGHAIDLEDLFTQFAVRGSSQIPCAHNANKLYAVESLTPDLFLPHVRPCSKYRVTGRLGEGAFGLVTRGVSLADGTTQMAIKKFKNAHGSMTYEAFKEFQYEAIISANLDNGFVLRLLGIDFAEFALVLELAPEGVLGDFLHKRTKEEMSIALKKKTCLDILHGLAYLHNRDPPLIHRDIRSYNVFMMSFDARAEVCAKIGDFGLSVLSHVPINEALESWQWLAPEVIEGKYYDYKSDVFSFGVVMYEIFSRILPYTNIQSLLHVSTTHVSLDKIDTEEKVEALKSLGYEEVNEDGSIVYREFQTLLAKEAICGDSQLRPHCPDFFTARLRQALEACWRHSPGERPEAIQLLPLIQALNDDDFTIVYPEQSLLAKRPSAVLSIATKGYGHVRTSSQHFSTEEMRAHRRSMTCVTKKNSKNQEVFAIMTIQKKVSGDKIDELVADDPYKEALDDNGEAGGDELAGDEAAMAGANGDLGAFTVDGGPFLESGSVPSEPNFRLNLMPQCAETSPEKNQLNYSYNNAKSNAPSVPLPSIPLSPTSQQQLQGSPFLLSQAAGFPTVPQQQQDNLSAHHPGNITIAPPDHSSASLYSTTTHSNDSSPRGQMPINPSWKIVKKETQHVNRARAPSGPKELHMAQLEKVFESSHERLFQMYHERLFELYQDRLMEMFLEKLNSSSNSNLSPTAQPLRDEREKAKEASERRAKEGSPALPSTPSPSSPPPLKSHPPTPFASNNNNYSSYSQPGQPRRVSDEPTLPSITMTSAPPPSNRDSAERPQQAHYFTHKSDASISRRVLQLINQVEMSSPEHSPTHSPSTSFRAPMGARGQASPMQISSSASSSSSSTGVSNLSQQPSSQLQNASAQSRGTQPYVYGQTNQPATFASASNQRGSAGHNPSPHRTGQHPTATQPQQNAAPNAGTPSQPIFTVHKDRLVYRQSEQYEPRGREHVPDQSPSSLPPSCHSSRPTSPALSPRLYTDADAATDATSTLFPLPLSPRAGLASGCDKEKEKDQQQLWRLDRELSPQRQAKVNSTGSDKRLISPRGANDSETKISKNKSANPANSSIDLGVHFSQYLSDSSGGGELPASSSSERPKKSTSANSIQSAKEMKHSSGGSSSAAPKKRQTIRFPEEEIESLQSSGATNSLPLHRAGQLNNSNNNNNSAARFRRSEERPAKKHIDRERSAGVHGGTGGGGGWVQIDANTIGAQRKDDGTASNPRVGGLRGFVTPHGEPPNRDADKQSTAPSRNNSGPNSSAIATTPNANASSGAPSMSASADQPQSQQSRRKYTSSKSLVQPSTASRDEHADGGAPDLLHDPPSLEPSTAHRPILSSDGDLSETGGNDRAAFAAPKSKSLGRSSKNNSPLAKSTPSVMSLFEHETHVPRLLDRPESQEREREHLSSQAPLSPTSSDRFQPLSQSQPLHPQQQQQPALQQSQSGQNLAPSFVKPATLVPTYQMRPLVKPGGSALTMSASNLPAFEKKQYTPQPQPRSEHPVYVPPKQKLHLPTTATTASKLPLQSNQTHVQPSSHVTALHSNAGETGGGVSHPAAQRSSNSDNESQDDS